MWGRRGPLLAAAAAMLTAACVERSALPGHHDVEGYRAYLELPADDPWCVYLGGLRRHLDDEGPRPSDDARETALATVRAEAETRRAGDPFWPFRKALMCEYLTAAEEEREEFDWDAVRDFIITARQADRNPFPTDGVTPMTPIFDVHQGGEAPSLAPVDVDTDAYCRDLATSELAQTNLRGVVSNEVSFPGSLRRAPDWFAMVQVGFHRWGREQVEEHQMYEGRDEFGHGGIPFHCTRYHNAFEGSREYAVKDNLIFLLPEIDDPEKAGRLEVTGADGLTVVLDKILAAAQLDRDGTGNETIDFFPEDLAASPLLAGVVERADSLPPPERFTILFEKEAPEPAPNDTNIAELVAAIEARDPKEPIRIVLTGHTDCTGSRAYNKRLSQRRVNHVFSEVIAPLLIARGFAEKDLANRDRLKVEGVGAYAKAGLGETAPLDGTPGGRCEENAQERRVSVLLQ